MARCLTLSVAGNECILWQAMEFGDSWESQVPAVKVSIFKAHRFQWECSRMSHMPVQRVWPNFPQPETPCSHQLPFGVKNRTFLSIQDHSMLIKCTLVNIGILFPVNIWVCDDALCLCLCLSFLCACCRQEGL